MSSASFAAATPTPPAAGLRPAPGRQTPLPEWVSTTDRKALPQNLDWASEALPPPINCRVDTIRFGIALGTGTVVGYFHRDNELGCLVALDSVSPALDLPAGTNRAHFFGENLRRLDQGEEAVDLPSASAPLQELEPAGPEITGPGLDAPAGEAEHQLADEEEHPFGE